MKSYSSAGQALLLLVLVPAYGAFASKVNRERLVTWVTLFFVANVVLFALAYQAGLHIGIAYFLWVGIFNVMVIAQFWAFANDLFTPEQGKRLFPLIGVGSSLGAWVGSVRAGQLVGTAGPLRLLLAAAAILVVCTLLARVVSRVASAGGAARGRGRRRQAARQGGRLRAHSQGPLSDPHRRAHRAAERRQHVGRVPVRALRGRTGQAIQGTGAELAAARERFIGETYSHLFSTVNLLGFLLQMFVVSRVFKYLGVGKALFIHPLVAGVGYLLMLRAPSHPAHDVVEGR